MGIQLNGAAQRVVSRLGLQFAYAVVLQTRVAGMPSIFGIPMERKGNEHLCRESHPRHDGR